MWEKYRRFADESRDCVVCGHAITITDDSIWCKDGFFYAVKCDHCHMVQVAPCVNNEGLSTFYSGYFQKRQASQLTINQRRKQYEIDHKFVIRFAVQGRLLDVGCGDGRFLTTFSDKFEKVGLELSEEAAKFAKDVYGLNVIQGQLGVNDALKGFFDVIVFRGVIEHLPDPKMACLRAKQLLKNNGLLCFLATPNVESFAAHVFREKWNQWHPIEHLNLFSSATLHKLVGIQDFELSAVEYPYIGTPYESIEHDYSAMMDYIRGNSLNEKSPPFWGTMMNVIFKYKE
jgi:SAM-dependent methyltransferase